MERLREAIGETAGAEGASYALRNLISAKKLVIETTVRNPLTGRLETQLNTVHGPTAVFQTTTQPDLHPETKSRFLVTSIDESEDQTRAILQAQRQSHTLEGLRRKSRGQAIIVQIECSTGGVGCETVMDVIKMGHVISVLTVVEIGRCLDAIEQAGLPLDFFFEYQLPLTNFNCHISEGNSCFYQCEGVFGWGIHVSEDYAYAVHHDSELLDVFEISDPDNKILVGTYTTDYIESLHVEGNHIYMLDGGLAVLEMTPNLSITRSSNEVTLSWLELPETVFTLDESPSLSPPMWTPSPSGSTNPVPGREPCTALHRLAKWWSPGDSNAELRQALRDKCEELADDVRNLSILIHSLRTALVAVGVVKGGRRVGSVLS